MNLRSLRTFIAIADSGGVGRAAAKLNLTQPTASRQIQALETELGVPLFDRVGRHVRLTSEGQDLLQRGRRVLADVEALGERARALKTGETGILKVGATPQAIESQLADFLGPYQRRHPGVEVEFVEDGGGRLPSRLESGDVHLAVMPEGDKRFHGRLLSPNCLLAVLPKTHRLGRCSVLDVLDLLDDPILLPSRGFASRDWFYAVCQIAHVRPRVLFESTTPQTLIALAGAGYGIALVAAGVLIPRGKVRVVPVVYRGATIGRWRMVAWDPQRFLPRYAEWFIEELVAYSLTNYPNRDLTRRAPPIPKPKQP
jgi:DNA-binding transcriptional LysR family regulator